MDATIDELILWMREGNEAFADRPAGEQRETVFTYRPEMWEQLVDFIYAHWDVFRLLARCTDIDCYEDMLNRMIDIEVTYTRRFLDATGHDMAKGGAKTYVSQLRRFFTQGWSDLLGL